MCTHIYSLAVVTHSDAWPQIETKMYTKHNHHNVLCRILFDTACNSKCYYITNCMRKALITYMFSSTLSLYMCTEPWETRCIQNSHHNVLIYTSIPDIFHIVNHWLITLLITFIAYMTATRPTSFMGMSQHVWFGSITTFGIPQI